MLIFVGDKFLPRLLGVPAENPVKVRIQLEVVRVEIMEQFLGAQHLGDLDQLVVVVVPMEERLLAEYHPREHAPQRPHIECIVVLLQVHQKLGTLEVPACHAYVVFPPRVVELRQSPVDQTQLPLLVVDHHVVRFDVAVHDSIRVTVVQRLQKLEYVIPNVVVGKCGIQYFEVRVVHVLEDQAWRLRLRVANDIKQLDDVCPTAHILQYLYLALDLFLLDRLQDLDHALGVVRHVDALEHLGVFPSPNFAYDLIVLLIPPVHRQGLIVPVVSGTVDIYISVHSRPGHDISI
mmetsp:Transcript_29998/g.71347  ORF Transcript_29998/g.71347 Transcript_29998/m.71347 type:complete len:291 (+) Transcript_29998:340-1212(+)